MKLKVEKPVVIEDGKHTGMITDVEYRTDPYNYTDMVIEMDNGMCVKAGYPTLVMEQSKLGLLLKRFGIVVADGLEVDPDCLIGKPCEFVTISEVTKKGTFAKVVSDSLKPCVVLQENIH